MYYIHIKFDIRANNDLLNLKKKKKGDIFPKGDGLKSKKISQLFEVIKDPRTRFAKTRISPRKSSLNVKMNYQHIAVLSKLIFIPLKDKHTTVSFRAVFRFWKRQMRGSYMLTDDTSALL